MIEILEADSFPCHKTTNGAMTDRRQCAGHMILKGDENSFVQLAARFGTPVELGGQEEVFDNEQDCIDHHTGGRL